MITEQQIRDMEPGFALNELVAEHVMGLPVQQKRKKFEWLHIQPYSTEISAAWEVIRKMEDYDFEILKAGEHCEVAVGSQTTLIGNNVPELICKAALIAHLRGESNP